MLEHRLSMVINVNHMHEFKAKKDYFIRRTRRRVMFEVSVLVLLTGYFWSSWSKDLPNWLELSVLGCFAAYILFGLAFYSKGKASVEKFSIYLLDNALGFSDQGHVKQIPYHHLTISKITKKNSEVELICLKTAFGHTIKLQGLENMTELHKEIINRVRDRTY